jgi:protein-S-isoprenylcysteine O-methyltransferase Ste14
VPPRKAALLIKIREACRGCWGSYWVRLWCRVAANEPRDAIFDTTGVPHDPANQYIANQGAADAHRAAMTIYGWLVFALWLTLVVYWSLASAAVMRGIGRRWNWWREIAVRLGFFALVVLALRIAVIGHVVPNGGPFAFNSSMLMGLVGFVCSIFGIGLAILAHAYLSRNRDTPVSSGESPGLITTGPYALVRHPLYGGLFLAILGSALAQSSLWLLPLIVYGPYIIRAARREEKLLIERYPERYPTYMKRTKMLLPFVI